jgi:hypothetical protein
LQAKYIDKFNKFLNRAFRYGYTQNKYSMTKMIEERDRLLFNKVMHNPEHCLYELLTEKRQRPLRERDHQFMLPMVYTERFKQSFLNRCLSMIFKFCYTVYINYNVNTFVNNLIIISYMH